ncbi:hypothetical protein [Mycobacterium sp. SMC-17]|uniref:hypothetical protein n=1 Tax=Mycobacterium sp. SMC-17 TaxID=3381628 RepID=UPI0038776135
MSMLAGDAVAAGRCDAVFEVADVDGTSRLPLELAHGIRFEQLSIPVDRGVSGDLRFGVLIAV